jgi:hypothetical protein
VTPGTGGAHPLSDLLIRNERRSREAACRRHILMEGYPGLFSYILCIMGEASSHPSTEINCKLD